MASLTMFCTSSNLATLAPLAMASPPLALMSSTTARAASLDCPVPSRAPPRSFTTTFAPRAAKAKAWDRPRPLPAPVTMATFPSNRIVMIQLQLLCFWTLPGFRLQPVNTIVRVSAINAGFSKPSISTVTSSLNRYCPGFFSVASTSLARARTFDPAGTGCRKRSLSSP